MKKKLTQVMLLSTATLAILLNTQLTNGQSLKTNRYVQQVETKELMLLPEAKDATLRVGETLNHVFLSQYITYKDGDQVTDYEMVPLYIKGEQHLENNVAIKKGKVTLRVGLKDLVTGEVVESNLCLTLCIVEDTSIQEEIIPHMPYIYGYEDGTFRPNRYVTREELASMVSRLLLGGARPLYKPSFTDLSEGRYSNNAIGHVSDIGVMEGYADGTFKPQAPVTHQEMEDVIKRTLTLIDKEGPSTMNSVYRGDDELLSRTEAVIVLNHVFERMCDDVEINNTYSDLTSDMLGYKDILHASILHNHTVIK